MNRAEITFLILQVLDKLDAQEVNRGHIATGVLQAAIVNAQLSGVSRAVFFDATAEIWDHLSGEPPPG